MTSAKKPYSQEKAEAAARAIRRASTPLEYSDAPVESCGRLHLSTAVQEDGTPQFTEPFVHLLNASVDEQRRAQAEAAEQAAFLSPRDWCTPAELARLLNRHPSSITRAIARDELKSTRPGGIYGHHRIAWSACSAYLTGCGYDEAAIAALRATWAKTMEVYG